VLTAALLVALNSALAAQTPAPAAVQPPPPDRPITRLFQNLGHDLVSLGSLDSAVMVGAGGVTALVASNSDGRVDRWTVTHPASSWTKIGRVGGDGWVMGSVALGTWAIGELTDHRLTTHIGSDLIRVQVLNGVLTTTLKKAVDRTRPNGGSHAFPSGHTSATFAAAGVVHQHFGWKAGIPAYAAASFVGLTRVRDRAHWVSDVVFGAAIGLASSRAVIRGHQSSTWSIVPVAVPGGGGIMFTRR
jgi:membrane-associated phospholipid phosphatase